MRYNQISQNGLWNYAVFDGHFQGTTTTGQRGLGTTGLTKQASIYPGDHDCATLTMTGKISPNRTGISLIIPGEVAAFLSDWQCKSLTGGQTRSDETPPKATLFDTILTMLLLQ